MARHKATPDEKINNIMFDFPNEFSKTPLKKLFCIYCQALVNFDGISRVNTHRKSKTHQKALDSLSSHPKTSPTTLNILKKDTVYTLCDTFVSTNIFIAKLRKGKWKKFTKLSLDQKFLKLAFDERLL